MTWTYTGPASGDKDVVRFLIADTNTLDQQISDEEIEYSLTLYSDTSLAAAYVLRALAAKYSRLAYTRIGEEAADFRGVAASMRAQANELDPGGTTSGSMNILPSFGGRSITEKDILYTNDDFVQPRFRRDDLDV